MFESVKTLEIKTSMLFSFFLLIILSYHASFFFSIIDLYFVIPAVIAQIFNPILELVIPIGIPSKEAKAEIEIHPQLL